ncbi:odorant receptor 49b-like isoform X1 [Nilaparvata lugens]|uniref:odorant receptor 49b-like isoform X1 n=1 Tax=Nilaparvata lugens TaxID=108931 RepID=UPI00193E134F|nr:odorant receptor 49b-like isoform X1 [Nilaparvata lugens]
MDFFCNAPNIVAWNYFQIFMMIRTRSELLDIIQSIHDKYTADGSHAEVENEQSRKRSLWLISAITVLQVPTFLGGIINSEYIGNNEDSIKANIHFGRKNPERLIAYLPWLPYDYTISPYFEVTKTLMYIALTMGCISMMVRYSVLPMLTFYINGQFDMIAKRFETLKATDEKLDDGRKMREESILNDIIRSHQQALSLSRRVIVYFRPIIVTKTIFYFGILADLLYAVTEQTAGTAQQINCCFCLMSCGYELLLDCWCGEYIARKSQLVGFAVYKSEWHNMSFNVRRSLAIVITRAQKPEQLNGRTGFIPMSLETYIQIFKASYSYYTVLQNLNKADQQLQF